MTTVAGNRGGAGYVPPLPEEAEIPLPTVKPDPDREAAIKAAMFYDRAKQERDDLMRLIEQSKMALEIRDNQIASLQLELATERNRFDALHNAYNEALQDRADLEAILTTQQAHHEDQAARLAKFEFSRLRRKRSAKRNGTGDSVSDNAGSETALAELASVVASGTGQSVLGSESQTGGSLRSTTGDEAHHPV